jgi:glycosyltransferase involved in cell wall biosynthesis
MRLAYLASHRIQYHLPLFRALAANCSFEAWIAHRQDAEAQAAAGYGVAFDWDLDFERGFRSVDLPNASVRPGLGRFGGVSCPRIGQWIDAFKPDAVVVGGWNLKVYWDALRACRRRGIAVLARSDSRLEPRRPAWVGALKAATYPVLLGRFDHHLPAGTLSAAYLSRYGVTQDRLTVVPHVVDVPRFATAAAASRGGSTDALGLDPARPVAGFVGRLLGWKRVDDLLHALARPALRGTQALIVGDGPERCSLERLAQRLSVPARFTGFVNQTRLPTAYAAMDVFVLASDAHETWGLVANEAMACGVPVVASRAAGCTVDLVVPGETGEHFACTDIDGLAAALCRALVAGRAAYAAGILRAMQASAPGAAASLLLDAAASACAARQKTPARS